MTLFVVMSLLTACSHYSGDAGPPYPPAVVGMEWAHDLDSTRCGIGLLTDGSAFVSVAIGHPWLAAAIPWLSWKVFDNGGGPENIATCWNTAQLNWQQFNLYTQCFGQPVLRSTWTSFSGAQAWVQIPTCINCNVACQIFKNTIAPFWWQQANRCNYPMAWLNDLACPVVWPTNAATTDSTDPPPGTEEPPQALPGDWAAPGWDVTAPIPNVPHPADDLLTN